MLGKTPAAGLLLGAPSCASLLPFSESRICPLTRFAFFAISVEQNGASEWTLRDLVPLYCCLQGPILSL